MRLLSLSRLKLLSLDFKVLSFFRGINFHMVSLLPSILVSFAENRLGPTSSEIETYIYGFFEKHALSLVQISAR